MNEIKRENDSYRGTENQSYNEFKKFEAEDFKSSEIVKKTMEAYKSEEVKKVSFVGSIKEKVKKKNEDKKMKELEKTLNSSTSSSSMSVASSIGGAGAVLIAGAAGAAIVLGPVVMPSNTEQGLIDYGKFVVNGYKVDKYFNEANTLLSDVIVYYDNDLLNGNYYPRLQDPLVENRIHYIDIDIELNAFVLENLKEDSYDLNIDIFEKKTNNIVGNEKLTIYTEGSVSYIQNEYIQDYLVTYNSDGTTNLYFQESLSDLENKQIDRQIKLVDDQENELDYSHTILDSGIIEILNIKETKYSLKEKVYLLENKAQYLVYQSTSELIDLTPKEVLIDATQSSATIKVDDKLVSDIEVTLKYNDKNTQETIVIPKDQQGIEVLIPLKEPSSDFDVIVRYSMNNNSTFNKDIPFNYKGSAGKMIREEKNFKFDLQSELNIEKIEFWRAELAFGVDSLSIYLNGYLKEDEYIGLEVKNQTGDTLYSIGYITDINKELKVTGLPQDELLTITYLTYKVETLDPNINLEGTDTYPYDPTVAIPTFSKTEDITISSKEEYGSIVDSGQVSVEFLDLKQYYTTLDLENESLNIYGDLNFINKSSYDVFIEATLFDFNKERYATLNSRDGLIKFENITSENPENEYYSIEYGIFVKDGYINYSISETGYSESYLGAYNEGNYQLGRYLENYINETNTNIYEISLGYEITSDVIVTVNVDEQTIEEIVTIPLTSIEDPQSGIFLLDISPYTVSAYINIGIETDINLISNIIDTSFIEQFEVKGTTNVKAKGSTVIYI